MGLTGAPQVAVLIQFRQFAQTLLHFLPSLYPLASGLLRSLGNIIASRLTLLPPEAHIQMGTMLWSISLTVAARSSAGAVGFRQRSENGDLGQTLNLAQQLASLGGGINRPGHGVSCALDSERWKIDSW